MDLDSLKNFKILIVDDEPLILEILIEEFEQLDAIVKSAKSGNQAFEILKNEKFDIVITDMKMPDGDGLSLLKKIKVELNYSPILYISSGFYNVTESEIKALNVKSILNKPFSISDFLKILSTSK